MKLKDIFTLKVNHGHRENFTGTEIRRLVNIKEYERNQETGKDEEVTKRGTRIITPGEGTRKPPITLVPMRSLSLEDFAFPFSNSNKIREALKLQIMPFTAAGELEIFPVVLSRAMNRKGVNGIVWYVSPNELDDISGKIWPAPLPFISQLDEYGGTGVTMWIDEENVCSILWQSFRPVLSRWCKLTDDKTRIRELNWYDGYCRARNLDRGGNFVVNASGDNDAIEVNEEFCEIVSESVELCPWINNVNLSRSAIEGARDLERTVKILTRVACWLLVIGGVMLVSGLLRWQQLQSQIQNVRARSEKFYRETFDPEHTGRISNPVTLARDKISQLSGTGTENHTIAQALADMGEIFTQDRDMNVTIDTVRYNNDGIDCTGTAPDMSTVLNFRKYWEKYAPLAQVDNTQFVSGIGYRFDLRVRW